MSRSARAVLLSLCIVFPLIGGAIAYLRLDSGIVESRLKNVPTDPASRLNFLRRQFREAGCESRYIREQPVTGEDLPNVSCTLPGSAKGTIVFSASLDVEETGVAAESEWAALAMLPLLAESLNGSSHRCTFVFIAFSGAQKSVGAQAYLSQLSEAERRSIVAMIDLQQLGWSTTYSAGPPTMRELRVGRRTTVEVPTAPEETPLSQLLLAAADTLKAPRPDALSEQISSTNSSAFQREQIATLVITSTRYISRPRFDGSLVRVEQPKLDLKAYYQSYNLLCVFGLHLDQAFGTERGKAAEHAVAESQITGRLLAVINGIRASAKLPPLSIDSRVTEDARQQAAAFSSNKRLNGDQIQQRLAKAGLMSVDASEVWFVLPEDAAKEDALIRESIGADAQRNFLDPRFTLAGVAAVHRGKSYFAVANLLSPMSDLSASDAELALLKAIQLERQKLELPEFQSASALPGLHDAACSMAKQDSLQAGVDAVKAPKVFAFTSGDPGKSSWVNQIASFGAISDSPPKINFTKVAVGICRAGSATASNETFWVLVQLDHPQ